jgi:hypothetical protein
MEGARLSPMVNNYQAFNKWLRLQVYELSLFESRQRSIHSYQ